MHHEEAPHFVKMEVTKERAEGRGRERLSQRAAFKVLFIKWEKRTRLLSGSLFFRFGGEKKRLISSVSS